MALAAIADDGDFLALDQIDVGIPVVIDAHSFLSLKFGRLSGRAAAKSGLGEGLVV
jgi:hypothetical protein